MASKTQRKPVIVVTGASRGIGLAATKALLEEFNAIVVAIARTRTPELVDLLEKHQADLLTIAADVADETAIRDAISLTTTTYNHLDGLVLNAAVLEPLGRIDSQSNTVDAWRSHFDVNFFSLIYTLQAALPSLRQSEFGGKVIFISSGSATGGMPAWSAYNASKAAMNSLCRTFAQEEPDIVSIALRPGMVDTAMQAQLRTTGAQYMRPSDMERFINAHRDGKLVKPEDSGHIIASLALHAPMSLSGQFVSWDAPEVKELRRSG